MSFFLFFYFQTKSFYFWFINFHSSEYDIDTVVMPIGFCWNAIYWSASCPHYGHYIYHKAALNCDGEHIDLGS